MRPFHIVTSLFIIAVLLIAVDPGVSTGTRTLMVSALGISYPVILFIGAIWPGASFYLPIINRVNTAEKIVALTFDDGPDEEVTPLLLDALRAAGIPATFFWVGEAAEKQLQLGQRAVAEGHLLANHTYRHSYAWNFKTSAAMWHELVQTNQVLERFGGPPIRFFRPPVGMTRPGIDKLLTALHMQPVAWSRKAGEGQSKSVENIIRRLTTGVTNGEILLLHETYYKIRKFPPEQIITVFNAVTRELQRQGFSFVRLDTLLARGVQPVAISETADRTGDIAPDGRPVCEVPGGGQGRPAIAGQLCLEQGRSIPGKDQGIQNGFARKNDLRRKIKGPVKDSNLRWVKPEKICRPIILPVTDTFDGT